MRENEEAEQKCDGAVQCLPAPAWQGENERSDDLKEPPTMKNMAMKTVEKDTNAKISALNDQIAKANAENKARIKERLVELRADHDRRVAKLMQAAH